jgi:DNA-binding NtrC family response regulator
MPNDSCILVIDDEDTVRRVTARALHDAGHRVLELPDAESALLVLARPDFCCSLVVTDIRMDGMSGTELAARLATSRPALPVLLVSGHADPSVASLAAGARRAFLQKPFTSDLLLRAVQRLLPNEAVSA